MTTDVAQPATQHIVSFYDDQAQLAEQVTAFLSDSLGGVGTAVAFLTPQLRASVLAYLSAAGVDVAACEASRHLQLYDAQRVLDEIRHAPDPLREAFDRIVGGIVRNAPGSQRVHIYGEMVALLWADGAIDKVLELEDCWNELGHTVRFSLMCGYPTSASDSHEHAHAIASVCDAHTAVVGIDEQHHRADTGVTPLELTATFPATPGAARAARRFLMDAIAELDWRGNHSDARLVVSELATNAITHAHSEFTVVVRRSDDILRLAVRDARSSLPALHSRGWLAESGRGLALVAALTRRWGHHPTDGGKVVWGELSA